MKKSDYIMVTNLQKFRIISDLLRDCLPSKGVPEDKLETLLKESSLIRDTLFKECEDLEE